jgi:hypothetical protein
MRCGCRGCREDARRRSGCRLVLLCNVWYGLAAVARRGRGEALRSSGQRRRRTFTLVRVCAGTPAMALPPRARDRWSPASIAWSRACPSIGGDRQEEEEGDAARGRCRRAGGPPRRWQCASRRSPERPPPPPRPRPCRDASPPALPLATACQRLYLLLGLWERRHAATDASRTRLARPGPAHPCPRSIARGDGPRARGSSESETRLPRDAGSSRNPGRKRRAKSGAARVSPSDRNIHPTGLPPNAPKIFAGDAGMQPMLAHAGSCPPHPRQHACK